MHSIVSIEKRKITVDEVRQSLADLFGSDSKRIDLLTIQRLIVDEFDVRPADLHSRSRTRSICF